MGFFFGVFFFFQLEVSSTSGFLLAEAYTWSLDVAISCLPCVLFEILYELLFPSVVIFCAK